MRGRGLIWKAIFRTIRPVSNDITPFEGIRRVNPAGNEFWSSRDVAQVLGYADYRNFEAVIEKGRTACFNSGYRVEDHFVDITEMIGVGSRVQGHPQDREDVWDTHLRLAGQEDCRAQALRDKYHRGFVTMCGLTPLMTPLTSLIEPLRVAIDNGARRCLLPIENKRQFLEVPGDIVERVDPIFFGDPMAAATKAVGNA